MYAYFIAIVYFGIKPSNEKNQRSYEGLTQLDK